MIEGLDDLDSVFDNFDHAKRKNIKRAEKTVTVKYDLPAKEFYENHKMTLAKQGQKISYSYDLFSRIYCAAYANNSGKTIYCTDGQDNIHAGLFVIWDDCSAYDLISTIDPAFRNSGAASLLIREVIKYVSSMTGKFDFEGSMIEPVERSFRSFGARQKPYFLISKDCRSTTKKTAFPDESPDSTTRSHDQGFRGSIVSEGERIKTCLNYTLQVLLGEEELVSLRNHIAYCEPKGQPEGAVRLCIVPSGFFGGCYGQPSSLPELPLEEIEGVPLLYGSPEIRHESGKLIVYADIIASAYFLLTRYEEMVRRDVRDEHGRFPGRESLPFRAGFIHRPIVEEYAALLRQWLQMFQVNLPKPRRRFSILLTHDVDCLRKYSSVRQLGKMTAGVALGRQSLRKVFEGWAAYFHWKKDPYDTFDTMIRLDTAFQKTIYSSAAHVIYFFPTGEKLPFENFYNIQSPTARRLISQIRQSGASSGIHTSLNASKNPKQIAKEKILLEEIWDDSITWNRHHYLSWNNISDGWDLAQAGIQHDSTLGYPDVAGFRLGMCHPFPLFDPNRLEPFGIEEHPLLVMDCTLTDPNYMNLNYDDAWQYTNNLIQQTKKYNGEFILLWHNTQFHRSPGNYLPELYEKILEELATAP